jgi:hypothetical protein
MFLIGILLMWFIFGSLLIGWAWIVGVAIAENDAMAAVLCAVLPLYIIIFAIARLNKTWIPLTLISFGLLGMVLMDVLFGTA